MLHTTHSLLSYASRALRQIWEDHDALDDEGLVLGTPNSFGRPETRFATLVRSHMYTAVAEWCGAPGRGVRVYTPGGAMDCGDVANVSHSLWFSGLWGAQVYEIFASEDRRAGRTPGYGVAYAVAEGADPKFTQIQGAGIVRLDTGETLASLDGSGTWLSKYEVGKDRCRPTSVAYHRLNLLSETVILTDAQLRRETAKVGGRDTGSSFGNAFRMLAGQTVCLEGTNALVAGAITTCGPALPAVYHLLRGCEGDMFLPEFIHVGSQKISSVIAGAMLRPAVLGLSTTHALGLMGKIKQ